MAEFGNTEKFYKQNSNWLKKLNKSTERTKHIKVHSQDILLKKYSGAVKTIFTMFVTGKRQKHRIRQNS